MKSLKIYGKRNLCFSNSSEYELKNSKQIVEQIVRPTGLIDPEIEIRSTKGQIDDLLNEVKERAKRNERTLITTLTKECPKIYLHICMKRRECALFTL